MNHIHRLATIAAILIAVTFFAAGCGQGAASDGDQEDPGQSAKVNQAPDPCDDHDHEKAEAHDEGDAEEHGDDEAGDHDEDEDGHEEDGHDEHEAAEPDPHAGHDHSASEGEDAAGLVELTAEQRRRVGLRLAKAGPGRIERSLAFPGETVLNPDRVVHVVPRASGVVREVMKTLGEEVRADEILAWIESAELAEAKLDFYAKEAAVDSSKLVLPRAREIFENVNRLLTVLLDDPSTEALAKLAGLEMGEHRGLLLTAHADLVAAEKALARELSLRGKAISSAQDLVAAQADHQRASASFNASLDSARYGVLVGFTEAARAAQVAEFEAVAAEQSLRLMGVDDPEIAKLRDLVPQASQLEPCPCSEPDCRKNELPSVRESLGRDRRLGWYALRAPFAGVVIEKHLSLGEKIGEEEAVLAIADTSTVWVNFNVFQKDLASIGPGQAVTVALTGGGETHTGRIATLSPIVDPDTRTAQARVVLANQGSVLRPGLFVNVEVALPPIEAAVVIPRSAVQILDEEEVVFVAEGDGFKTVPVTLGRGDRDEVEIKSGLAAGQRYVQQGAFELKAKIATSGMDAHAGHGH